MSAPTSLKDLTKAINNYVAEPSLPLPDDLVACIADYLAQHQRYDEAAADKLQEELLSIFEKNVKGDPGATGAWIAILRRLIPVLQTPERILPWFEPLRGILDHPGNHKKTLIDEAIELAKCCDEYFVDDDGATISPYIDKLFKMWMERVYPQHIDGTASMEYSERMIREGLIQCGKKRTKDFFNCLDTYFVKKQHRRPALRILCDFLQNQPPHLYQILQTPFFSSLLTCLQVDTSTSIVSAALTALIMLLPHMPSSLVPYLPRLFNIYARLLFWNRERSGNAELPLAGADQATKWEPYSMDLEDEEWTIAHLSNYYTMLYGLYPINFMDYIRKPQRYLRHANVSNPDSIEIQPSEIRDQSERFRRNHLLHPNFYSLTIESEKTDFGRWIKSEAAEVMADCMALCLASDHEIYDGQHIPLMPGAPPSSATDDKETIEPALLSSSVARIDSWRNLHSLSAESLSSNRPPSTLKRHSSQSSHPSNRDSSDINIEHRIRDTGFESPTLSPQLTLSSSQTQLQDLLQSNKAIKTGLKHSLTSDSLPSLALSQHESMADKQAHAMASANITSPMSQSVSSTQVLHLQRQILLLQNDLSFERYLKQQHMLHIGELRRRHVTEAATEAEMQNLIMMNRSLKSRFEEAKKAEMQVRKESEKSRAMAKKWEADLANKLKTLRDESKKLKTDFEAMQRELEDTKQECEKLRKLVCDGEVKELNYQQNMQSVNQQMAEIDRLTAEVERLTLLDLDHQAKEVERRAALQSAAESQSQVEGLLLKLAAQEEEVQKTKVLFQSQIVMLQDKLSEALAERERAGPISNPIMQQALAASRTRQSELQQQYSLLMRKYTTLQSSLLDMQAGAGPSSATVAQGKFLESESEADGMATLTRHLSDEMDFTHRPSTPDVGEASPRDMRAPPLAETEAPGSGGIASSQTPQTPLMGDDAAPGTSPEQRYFGRGMCGYDAKCG
ncbi:Hamartin protein-domain-containing protein [Stachybotrys elegans]|uniref:Hamartin protein-domain-containing protein n=1 Tax=Stachybotrys elegans TaxID=80388 RepID=A0A8K0SZY5_9HYPO|nr:Hamartin protein-domain-containing protein [Stachybotrys elegans]